MAKVVLIRVEIRLSTIGLRGWKGHVELAGEAPSGLDSSGSQAIAATQGGHFPAQILWTARSSWPGVLSLGLNL